MRIGPVVPSVSRAGVEPLIADRLSDRLAARLMDQIERGGLKPGDRLPTEAQLAATHGVSRSVVREAVHQVKSRGLLRSRQGSGVYVSAPPQNRSLAFDPKVMESLQAVVQVVELRRVLEGEMAALAAERATRTQIAGLKRALAAIDAATDAGHLGLEEDFAFHRAIGEATGNPQFPRLLAFLEQYLLDAMRVTKGNEARRDDWMQQVRAEHRAIFDGIAARDPPAARSAAIEHHLHGAMRLQEGGVVALRKRVRPQGGVAPTRVRER
jgi:GntR family transcriptional regulator, transcriptional repressor for pyruvate dehydrogenase complex